MNSLELGLTCATIFFTLLMFLAALGARRFPLLGSVGVFLALMLSALGTLMVGIAAATSHHHYLTPQTMKTWEQGSGKIVSFVNLSDTSSTLVVLDTKKTVQLANPATSYRSGQAITYSCIPTNDQTQYYHEHKSYASLEAQCIEATTTLEWQDSKFMQELWQPLLIVGNGALYMLLFSLAYRRATKAKASLEPVDTVETV